MNLEVIADSLFNHLGVVATLRNDQNHDWKDLSLYAHTSKGDVKVNAHCHVDKGVSKVHNVEISASDVSFGVSRIGGSYGLIENAPFPGAISFLREIDDWMLLKGSYDLGVRHVFEKMEKVSKIEHLRHPSYHLKDGFVFHMICDREEFEFQFDRRNGLLKMVGKEEVSLMWPTGPRLEDPRKMAYVLRNGSPNHLKNDQYRDQIAGTELYAVPFALVSALLRK
jgi:hypothetical protein